MAKTKGKASKTKTSSERDEYVLGTGRDELDRLGLQHQAWRAQAYEHWERAGFAPGQAILDVGSGPGFATRDLARVVGATGRVTAVDVSRRFLDHVAAECAREGLANVTVVESDVQALALEPASHDGAWCRWVNSFVPEPRKLVAGVARALRPGAAFALQEYVSYACMRLGPGPARALPRVVEAIEESWTRQNGRADVALALPAVLAESGFHVASVRPIARVVQPGTLAWEWPSSFFQLYVPKLAAQGLLSESDARAFLDEWREHSENPDAVFVCPMVLEITALKA